MVGFDIFDVAAAQALLASDPANDKEEMNKIFVRVPQDDLTLRSVHERLKEMKLTTSFLLVDGDVEYSLPNFLKENPGFMISLLYIDVDIERPTYFALKYLWDRIVPGGVIVFDEYEYHKFSESRGVTKFLKELDLPFDVKTTHFVSPTAFMFKKS